MALIDYGQLNYCYLSFLLWWGMRFSLNWRYDWESCKELNKINNSKEILFIRRIVVFYPIYFICNNDEVLTFEICYNLFALYNLN